MALQPTTARTLFVTGLSDRAKELIPQARIVSFDNWDGLSDEARDRLQAADDSSQYLTDEDLSVIAKTVPSTDPSKGSPADAAQLDTIAAVTQLRDQAASVVDEARAGVLDAFPGILDPGGGLYPPVRAEACWRDFWQFLRCITYGIAGQQVQYTSPKGLAAMELLYEELQVPLPAMVKGLEGIKAASLSRFDAGVGEAIAPYFDHLIAQLSAFVKQPS